MDITTIGGIVAGLAVICVAIILDGDLGSFVNLPGLMIVFGGTISATLVKFPLKEMIASLKVGMKVALQNSKNDPQYIYDKALEMSGLVRKGGLLALENVDIENELFQRGIVMCTDGHSVDVIRATIDREMIKNIQQQEMGETLWRGIGAMTPAWGMIGTLVGLIQMLSNLDDPAAIGPAMAIAMLTTFYGAVVAFLVAVPLADKLQIKTEFDRMTHELIVESVMQIQQNQSPAAMGEILAAYLPTANSGAGAEADTDE